MADASKAKLLDGYTAFQAARRANLNARASADDSDPMVRAREKGVTQRGEAPGTRIGRTALPTAKEVVCMHCAHAFPIVGAQSNVMCPGCREWLQFKEVTIKSSGWTGSVTTAGSFVVQASGVVAGGEVLANNIVVRGKVEGGVLRATHQLEIHKGAEFDLGHIEALDLVIHRGAEFAVEDGRLDRFRDIDVHGALSGDVRVGGVLTVHRNGLFKGSLTAAGLEVEGGGQLDADVRIQRGA